jgi:hypothetical protein
VIIDHKTGKVAETEPITEGEDLTAAKAQAEAMAKAKSSLHDVAAKGLEANKGSQAVSVAPSVKDGRPIAAVTLVKDDNFKTISSQLD